MSLLDFSKAVFRTYTKTKEPKFLLKLFAKDIHWFTTSDLNRPKLVTTHRNGDVFLFSVGVMNELFNSASFWEIKNAATFAFWSFHQNQIFCLSFNVLTQLFWLEIPDVDSILLYLNSVKTNITPVIYLKNNNSWRWRISMMMFAVIPLPPVLSLLTDA